jgi:hypothetical protein
MSSVLAGEALKSDNSEPLEPPRPKVSETRRNPRSITEWKETH